VCIGNCCRRRGQQRLSPLYSHDLICASECQAPKPNSPATVMIKNSTDFSIHSRNSNPLGSSQTARIRRPTKRRQLAIVKMMTLDEGKKRACCHWLHFRCGPPVYRRELLVVVVRSPLPWKAARLGARGGGKHIEELTEQREEYGKLLEGQEMPGLLMLGITRRRSNRAPLFYPN
jgi:hypothetical protein